MTATVSLVAGSQPDGLIAAAAQLGSSIASLEMQIAAQREALGQLVSGWQGDAAQAAVLRAEKNLQPQLQLQVRLRAMQSALHGGGEQLSALRTQLLSAAGQATSLGGLVSDDGSVRATGGGRFMTPALAAAYTALLKALLTAFDAVDQATASALTKAGAPQAPPHPSAPTIPEKGADPHQVKRWWESLRPEERQRLADEQPGPLGGDRR